MFKQMTGRAQGAKQPALRAVTNRIEAIGGVNMSQGKCHLPVHPIVKDACHRAVMEGWNTATLRNGTPLLREQIRLRSSRYNNLDFDLNQIAITHGVTGGLECICRMFIEPGDEVVLFKPAFPYYEKMIRLRGGIPKFVTLSGPDWTFDSSELEAAFGPKTKLILFCTPSNPTGKVFTKDELNLISKQCLKHNVLAISDEVYEYHLASGKKHVSIASLPGMFKQSLTLSSVSKCFFATGWRIGWAIGPEDVIEKFSIHSDQLFLCANSLLQYASAYAYQGLPDSYFEELAVPFNTRQERLKTALNACGFETTNPHGGYFVMARYEQLGFESDLDAIDALIKSANIGAAPGFSFEPNENKKTGYLRFSCAISDAEMDRAIQGLEDFRS